MHWLEHLALYSGSHL